MFTNSRQTPVESWRDELVSAGRIETPQEARFRYGYLCRLIDDSELDSLPKALRARTRTLHKSSYWKSLSLLRRDAERVLKARRARMSAERAWDFQSLVSEYTRIQMMLGKLTVAGLSHSIYLGTGMEAARQASREVEAFLSAASFAPAPLAA